MKSALKASVAAVVLVLGTAAATADTIQLGSYETGGASLGNANTAVAFVGSSTATFALDPDGVWAAPGANSEWVSNNAGSGPGGSVVEASGIYSYTTSFTTQPGNAYTGSISILADDTTDVLFNGITIEPEGPLGSDAKCADAAPNCRTPTLIILPSGDFVSGVNTLQFDLQQTIASTGLDFYGAVNSAAVPEPESLLLLSTGLFSAAGFLRRKLL
ncbi:MAG: PEP-CTERM sorting domain-containing protein [Acidobacteriaceae bacterium]|nr:PEP-CTERM sorting domain-containing protein [Acidobacteriaceae bacterium]